MRSRIFFLLLALLSGAGCSGIHPSLPSPVPAGWECDAHADELMKSGDVESSIVLHEQLILRDPANALAHYHLGYGYGLRGDHEREAFCYERAVELGLTKEDLFFNLGMAYGELHLPERAIAVFRKGLALHPRSANNHFGLAMAYEGLGEGNGHAEKAYLKAIELDPGFVEARFRLALLYAHRGERDKASAELLQILQMDPSHGMARETLKGMEEP